VTLVVAWRLNPYADRVQADVARAQWRTVEDLDADEIWSTLMGEGPGDREIVLDGTAVTRFGTTRGVAAAGCTLDPMPTMRVVDVVGLGLHGPRLPLWQTLLGTRRARSRADDDEARARAVAGRTGIAAWVDRTAVDLPAPVGALVDVTRAVAGPPAALLLRRPDWLDPWVAAETRDVVAAEQRIHGFGVIEIARPSAGTLTRP